MKEYVTDAIVLETKPRGETDRVADLFTKEFGRIEARVTGGRKILSKFSPHLNSGTHIVARLVRKNSFTLTDALSAPRQSSVGAPNTVVMLPVLFLLRTLVPSMNPDLKLWYALLALVEENKGDISSFLSLLGHGLSHAKCETCGSVEISYFFITDQTFICAICSVKFPEDTLLYISTNHLT